MTLDIGHPTISSGWNAFTTGDWAFVLRKDGHDGLQKCIFANATGKQKTKKEIHDPWVEYCAHLLNELSMAEVKKRKKWN